MDKEINKIIDTTLSGLDGVQAAETPVGFTQKVLERWEKSRKALKIIPMRTVWTVAAAVTLLLAANIWMYSGKSPRPQSAQRGVQEIIHAYGLETPGFSY